MTSTQLYLALMGAWFFTIVFGAAMQSRTIVYLSFVPVLGAFAIALGNLYASA